MIGRENGAQGRNRTIDTRIFNPLLYQLSYLGAAGCECNRWSRVLDRPRRVGVKSTRRRGGQPR